MFLISPLLHSQDIQQGEFMVVNKTGGNGYSIKIDIYPVGAIFNGNYEYALKAAYPIPQQNDKIWGVQQYELSNQTAQNWFVVANFDKSEYLNGCHFSLGYGRYRIDFYEGVNKTFTCDIDFSDVNFTGISTSTYYQQMRIDYNGSTDVKLQFYGANSSPYNISNEERLCVWEQKGTLNGTQTQNKGSFTDYSLDAQQYHDYPINATQQPYGFFKHISPEEIYLNLKVTNFDANLSAYNTLMFYNSIFNIANGKTYTIHTNYTIYPIMFIGEEAKFVSGKNSTIIFPENTGLKTELNAQIECNGTNFTSSSGYWEGISLITPGGSSFNNCTFTNAKISIYSLNNNLTGLSITNNTFTIPQNNSNNAYNGINLGKTNNVSIISNHFYFPPNQCENNCGIVILNQANSEEENNDAPWYRINIIDNYFHGGNGHISIGSINDIYTAYINNNKFYEGAWSITLANVTGTFSDNTTYSNFLEYNCGGESQNVFLYKDHSNFLNNVIIGRNNNFRLDVSCYPYFEPLQIDNQFLWRAGKNKLISSEYTNIYAPISDYSGYFKTNYGNNEFNTPGNYHLLGYLNDVSLSYKSLGNCWKNGDIQIQPIYDLKNIDNHPMEVIYDPPYCNDWNDQIVDRIITDMGNGILDTVLVTQSSTIPPPSYDAALYGMGVKNKLLKNYSSAIINFKNLIDTYPNSKHLGSTVFNLYDCYVLSDTNRTQSFRNVIFGNLKNYLEDKILQYENNDEFVNVAFDFDLKCKVKIKSYPIALDGYEFIAENSPSATERLMASLSYIDVEGLIQGGNGGSVKENKNAFKAIGNINKQEKKTPIKDILLKVYSKAKENKKQKENLDLQKSNDISKTSTNQDRKHNFEKTIENRALNNISISGSLNAEQRRERIRKDLLLLAQKETDNNTTKEINSLPINYSLSQNYPNPFNPVTKISYSIAKQGLVTLKIYDIIGREIKTLVNEVKQAGYYTVDFNGSSLASGVYFYRIQSGDFISVKRMVLIK